MKSLSFSLSLHVQSLLTSLVCDSEFQTVGAGKRRARLEKSVLVISVYDRHGYDGGDGQRLMGRSCAAYRSVACRVHSDYALLNL